jgi:hypothetical protein
MRRIGSRVLLAGLLLLLLAPAARSFAWDHGHGHRHGHRHGHWHGGHYWGGPRVVVGIGPAFGWGYYPGYWYYPPPYYRYPGAYWPAPAVREEPDVYVERPSPPAAEFWYYCDSAGGYYPHVKSCPEPWVKVPPRRD